MLSDMVGARDSVNTVPSTSGPVPGGSVGVDGNSAAIGDPNGMSGWTSFIRDLHLVPAPTSQ